MMNKGILFVVSGPSGTGKGTICKELEKDENIFLSISSTSREIRPGEKDGVTYNYKTREGFEKMIAEGQMLEWATYDGNYYGTPKSDVEKMIAEGKNIILEIDVQGAFKIKEIFPETILIFVVPPSMKELKNRLVSRGREGEESINARLERAREELVLARQYDYILMNDDLTQSVEEMRNIIIKANADRAVLDSLLNENL